MPWSVFAEDSNSLSEEPVITDEGQFADERVEAASDYESDYSEGLVKNGQAKSQDALTSGDFEYIEDDVFEGHAIITMYRGNDAEVTVPEALGGLIVTDIGDKAFSDSYNLERITIPNTVKSIGDRAFYQCFKLKHVAMSDYITSIGDEAFYCCENLTDVVIPEGIQEIGSNVFYGCGITSIVIPSGYPEVPDGFVCSCEQLESVTIPESVTRIGKEAFGWCEKLSNIKIPAKVKAIGKAAFLQTGITAITIPNGVTTIESEAFYCTPLKSITIPDSVTSIGNLVFNGCEGLETVKLPNNIKSIEELTFQSCSSLESITIPNGVESIGHGAFGYSGLKHINIPNSVTSIGDGAFADCENLESIKLPDGLKSIDGGTFYDCYALKSITIPEGVTEIGESAFNYCTSLVSATIPESVKIIDNTAFYHCTALKDIFYGGTKSQWASLGISLDGVKIHYSGSDMPDPEQHTHIIKSVSKAATCQEAGIKKHYECIECGKMFKDAKGSKELTAKQIKKLNIKKKAHSYKKKITTEEYLKSEATCTKKATYFYACSMCELKGKKTYKVGKALGHSYDTFLTRATPTTDGSVVKKCTRCGKKAKTTKIYKASKVSIAKKYQSVSYIGGNAESTTVTVKNSKKKTISKDNYDLTFRNDYDTGVGTVTVTFKGNYSGTLTLTYKITGITE